MHPITRPEIDQYCQEKSAAPSKVLIELYDYTKQSVPFSEMITGPLVSAFLKSIAKMVGAKRALEIGCYTGYSALSVAEALPQDGELITLDLNEDYASVAKKFWGQSEHGKKIKLILGPAITSLQTLKGTFDFVLIDADKENYPHYLKKSLELLSPGGVILLDNSLRDGRVLERDADEGTAAIKSVNDWISQNSSLHSVLVPIRDGIFMVQKN